MKRQPPSGGCELKQAAPLRDVIPQGQPPSGGCELKHYGGQRDTVLIEPAAFGRL